MFYSVLLASEYVFAAVVFICGFIINMHSDSVLRSLRKPGELVYKIPQRGLFKYVTNAHYLGEILEWAGWALLTWSPAGLAFALFTVANLLPRAHANHKWYKSQFPGYPENRRVLLPYIY